MAYVPVPKDLTKVKSKVMFNLTKRQLICFGCGGALGIPLYFLLRDPLGTTTAALLMIFTMLPFFAFAMYEKNGQPLEIILRQIIDTLWKRPKERPYETHNLYGEAIKQDRINKEVQRIVKGKPRKTKE